MFKFNFKEKYAAQEVTLTKPSQVTVLDMGEVVTFIAECCKIKKDTYIREDGSLLHMFIFYINNIHSKNVQQSIAMVDDSPNRLMIPTLFNTENGYFLSSSDNTGYISGRIIEEDTVRFYNTIEYEPAVYAFEDKPYDVTMSLLRDNYNIYNVEVIEVLYKNEKYTLTFHKKSVLGIEAIETITLPLSVSERILSIMLGDNNTLNFELLKMPVHEEYVVEEESDSVEEE